jgi:tetratricopeptide (TPR) repeat protein
MIGAEETHVFNRFAKVLLSAAVLIGIGTNAVVAQAPEKKPEWKDGQAEYNLFDAANKATAPAAKLAALDAWKAKYPESDFKEARLVSYLATYRALGQAGKMVDTAKEILAINPKDVNALMWLTALTETYPVPPTDDSLATGEKAARALPDAAVPQGVKEEDWAKVKTDLVAISHKTLGFIASQRKQYDVVEQEYGQALASIPNPPCPSQLPVCAYPAQVSQLLGMTIIAEKKPERYTDALFYLAKAVSYSGPGALPDANRRQVDAFLVKAYNTYHGNDDAGLKELRALASSQPKPPTGFTIKNKNDIAAENAEKAAKADPQAALWKSIKDQLTADAGQQYFDTSVKGAALPGGANGVTKFKGTLISQKPALNPKELVLGITSPDTQEVTLKLENPLRGKAEPGTVIQFEGVPSAFTKEPFMLTFDVDSKDKIQGWPAQAAPPAKKRVVARKKKQ